MPAMSPIPDAPPLADALPHADAPPLVLQTAPRARAPAVWAALLTLCLTTLGAGACAASGATATKGGAQTITIPGLPGTVKVGIKAPHIGRVRLPKGLKPRAGRSTTTARATGTTGASGSSTTPTTTYVPAGGASAPSATTPAATTPAIGTRATTGAQSASGRAGAPASTRARAGAKSGGGRSLSTGAIVIAALAALLVLACLAWALARRSAFEPHWLLSLRHATAEAGFRASETWSEFADWARLGR
jgi:hypothetical protein